jgi:hypothetical protein
MGQTLEAVAINYQSEPIKVMPTVGLMHRHWGRSWRVQQPFQLGELLRPILKKILPDFKQDGRSSQERFWLACGKKKISNVTPEDGLCNIFFAKLHGNFQKLWWWGYYTRLLIHNHLSLSSFMIVLSLITFTFLSLILCPQNHWVACNKDEYMHLNFKWRLVKQGTFEDSKVSREQANWP